MDHREAAREAVPAARSEVPTDPQVDHPVDPQEVTRRRVDPQEVTRLRVDHPEEEDSWHGYERVVLLIAVVDQAAAAVVDQAAVQAAAAAVVQVAEQFPTRHRSMRHPSVFRWEPPRRMNHLRFNLLIEHIQLPRVRLPPAVLSAAQQHRLVRSLIIPDTNPASQLWIRLRLLKLTRLC